VSRLAPAGVKIEIFEQAIPEAQSGFFDEVIGQLRHREDCQPAKWKGVEKFQGWSEDALVGGMEEERLPDIDAIRKYAYVYERPGVEQAADDRGRVADTPKQEESYRDPAQGETKG
jgi:hypothetical protein